MFNYEVKFLTCDESLHLKNGDFKTYKYETKKKVEESVYDVGKRTFCERRGGYWRTPRPRQIRQLESKLRDRSVVFCDWSHEGLITLVFSSGAIAYLTVKAETLDVTQILFDRYCVGKLSGQTVTGVIMCKSHLLFTHADRVATLISFGKNTNSTLPCRITDRDPHLQSIELGGGARRIERRISWCEHGAGIRVLVWGAAAVEPAPWSPAMEDLANLHLYQIQGQQITLIAYHQLENETLSAELSFKSDNIIHVVEQITSHKTGVTLDWLRYEVPTSEDKVSKLSSLHESATHVSLPAPARVARRSPCDSRLLVACIDGSLHVIHHSSGLMHSTKAGFIATDVRWAGELIVACEEAGRLQCCDRALAALHQHTKCLDLAPHLRDARRMQLLAHKNMKGGPLILVSFAGGPLTLLRITHPRLLTAWIRSGRTSNAVALLRALDWSSEGTECLWAVNQLVCAALRAGLQGGTGEAAAQTALGAFLAPSSPHGTQAQRFAPPVHDLARKFFHHLLRRGRVEKALSLAVDLEDWDLFADARWAATRRGLQPLAEEAASLAAHYAVDNGRESDCSESCSQCSSHTYSGSDAETSASSEAVRTKPPPLPRVPIPQNPTIMPVPITQTEPSSTNSIRPNLHQYLERDNTIWNIDIQDDSNIRNILLRDDTNVRGNGYSDHIKPILNTQMKWHSVDNVLLNYKLTQKHILMPISECSSKPYEGSSRPYEGSSRPYEGSSRPYEGSSRSYEGSSRSYEGSSRSYEGSSRPYEGPSRSYEGSSRSYEGSSRPFEGLSRPYEESSIPYEESSRLYEGSSRPYEGSSKSSIADVIPRPHDERIASHFRHLYQTELREDAPNTLYRYQNNYHPMNDRVYRLESEVPERQNRSGEKNKVKFSDKVTVNVVAESPGPACPEPARELADSLPLCPPHKYLTAFAPHPPPAENAVQKPPKIKVVHFGMV